MRCLKQISASYSTVVFLDSELPSVVAAAGWREWHPGETTALETAYYAEYKSIGPGANPSARDPHSHQLSDPEAQKFLATNFLWGNDGWDPLHPESLKHVSPEIPSRMVR